jgi:integrative and conjugative element protein (TIGR02256 family)
MVEFREKATACLMRYRQLSPKAREAGGMLLGRLIDETQDVVIDAVTIPSHIDKRGRFFFFRDRLLAQRHVNIAWQESGHIRIYLGEWHSHPEDDPCPSQQDLKNWQRIGRATDYEQDFLLFVIVGRKNTRIWELGKGKTLPVQLEPSSIPSGED